MTKEITKAFILQEMQDKFRLRELEPEKFSFAETVVPVYSIEQHLEKREIVYAEKSIISAPYSYNFWIVPQSERWKISAYNVIFMASGAYTVTGLSIRRSTAVDHVYYDMVEGQTVSYAVVPSQPIVVEAGDRVNVYVDSYTSTADLRLYIDVVKEEIR